MNGIRLFIVDDHPTLRAGIGALVATEPDIQVIGECPDGLSAITCVNVLQPDVVLLDLDLPQLSGLEVARRIRASTTTVAVLIFSAYADPCVVREAITIGVAGYLTKDEPPACIVRAIRSVANGEVGWVSRAVAAIMMQAQSAQPAPPVAVTTLQFLTPREHDVLRLLAHGSSNTCIATTLQISAGTVKNHVLNISTKIGVHSRAEAVAWAWQHGLGTPE